MRLENTTSRHSTDHSAQSTHGANIDRRLTRRRLIESLTTGVIASSAVVPVSETAAQTAEATPIAAADSEPELTPIRGGALRMVRPGSSVANFNPAAFAQDLQFPLSYLEPVLRPDPKTMEPTPWLAERWTWHERGLRLVLSLREGVNWHNGTAFEAADAVFSYMVYRDDAESAVASIFSLVESLTALSAKELEVLFLERDPNWLFNGATLPIFSRRQYEVFWNDQGPARRTLSGFDWSSSLPQGTGPWRVERWDEQRVQFARFDDYWGQPTWLDALEVSVELSPRERFDAWNQGDSDIAWPVSNAESEEIESDVGSVVPARAASVMFAAFNFANPNQPNGSLWSDPRVRQAASMAVDRERYAEVVFGGNIRAQAVGTIAQPWAHDESLTTGARNREAAAVLLAEAGWIDYDGDGILEDVAGTPLRPVAIVREDSRPELLEVLAHVARDLFAVGIGLSIEALTEEEFEDRWIFRHDFDLICYAYDLLPGFTDFDLYGTGWDIRTNPAGWNPGGYSSPDADGAISEFLGSVSIERQRSALFRLQKAVNDDLFGIWLGFPDDLVLVANEIAGFEPDIAWQTAQTAQMWRLDADR